MGKYFIDLSDRAVKELAAHKKAGDKTTIKRIERILEELSEHPTTGFASPEQLKGNLSGFWSRQINKKDRLIYTITDSIVTVFVVSAKGHYTDK
ncbi:MAG: Txe/YoeB family addiction module toxin [Bacteroidota bacterium]|nr:Txe/YoeB family addiction module toxin [Bacteroidota bacterium]